MWLVINRFWRLLATAVCFGIFGLGGLIISFILIPLIRISCPTQEKREYRVQALIRLAFSLFCKIMKFSGAMDYKFSGIEKLTNDRHCLLIANHPTLIDYVLITSQLKQCDCLVKSDIWSNPFIKHIVNAAGYIPNKTPDDLIKACETRLNKGNVLLIFPEGTRTTQGKSPTLRRGAAQVAIRTQTDLRIIHISVSPSFLTKEKMWYKVPREKPVFHIEVKDKIEVRNFIQETDNPTLSARRLNNYLAEVIFPNHQ
ncbi:lysophospholipid acyltransferase family protein [Vibrio mangrovi]|uniref:2-acyl-glycerophospho-ethanolamine acyltransferase n=1 Tax=Vibrio mangrovi TaxID=474394 RepID=A0A1Y6IR76_9VIBR|nr:lysophospholipid acyltransferase family protein [Vibrio mangrovi]MDW6001845.1 lysophospholipid acyltransferase family protein [Vibrio mangrovi]SMS00128.1 2-acyl-glycerophospho-ethanolamine acyltransferase [Vibrio mangrovi]